MTIGKFVVFEGIDGSGKSTQCQLLYDRLVKNEIPAALVREPGGTKTGEQIREWLSSGSDIDPMSELLLFSAARSALIHQKIMPALHQGRIVISDRYMYSSIAYQSFARGVDLDKTLRVNAISTGELIPNIVFLIDMPPEISLQRIDSDEEDRFEKEQIDFHRKVRQGFLHLASQDKDLWSTINGENRRDDIHEAIWAELNEKTIG